MNSAYTPINCTFHDKLLDLATLRKVIEIHYLDPDEKEQVVEDRIVDIYTRKGEEFMVLHSGIKFRLDYLISADGMPLSEWQSC
ncbi:hypothetical protein KFE98_12350 [bacterium SCSIO 12741]|nr:hypothetical protein KFE98_12350 [bacterium SCSIO 12741]